MAVSGAGRKVVSMTAAADSIVTTTPGVSMLIQRIKWTAATTAAHTCVINNADGEIIWRGIAAAANHSEEAVFDPPLRARGGITVATLTSGILLFTLT